MIKKKKQTKVVYSDRFSYISEITLDNKIIQKGDIIKIKGERGTKFRFESLTINNSNGVQWVDCFELHRGMACRFRSFDLDKVKRVPKKRIKRVN